eukprot:UN3211
MGAGSGASMCTDHSRMNGCGHPAVQTWWTSTPTPTLLGSPSGRLPLRSTWRKSVFCGSSAQTRTLSDEVLLRRPRLAWLSRLRTMTTG